MLLNWNSLKFLYGISYKVYIGIPTTRLYMYVIYINLNDTENDSHKISNKNKILL